MSASDLLVNALSAKVLLDRVLGCSAAAKSGDPQLLPILKSFIEESNNRETHDVCVAARAIGAILRSQLTSVKFGIESGALPCHLQKYVDFLFGEVQKSGGIYTTSLIFALCLIGPAAASPAAAQIVTEAVERNYAPDKLKLRAYQYACAVDKSLLKQEPWCSYAPSSEVTRAEWDIDKILADYT